MSKPVSPLLGYNNNVRHKNRVFHIQTEDSGIKHPHIITHLFMDGGRILKSIKRSYAEHVGADKMQDTVKQMMKEQHKAMFIALRDGQFDAVLEDGQAAREKALAAAAEGAAAADAAGAARGGAATSADLKSDSIPILTNPPAAGDAPRADDVNMVPQTTRTPEIDLEIDPLERGAGSPGSGRTLADLPPPPANMFREKSATSGAYRSAPPAAEPTRRGSSIPPKKIPSAPPKKPPSAPPKKPASLPPPRGKSPSEGRYAAARPAAIFGPNRPQSASSIFGEDLISDKSLDEVILSYLAEDLEPPPEKKK